MQKQAVLFNGNIFNQKLYGSIQTRNNDTLKIIHFIIRLNAIHNIYDTNENQRSYELKTNVASGHFCC